MVDAGPVTTLALNIVVRGVLDRVVPGRNGHRVSQLAHGVAAIAEVLRMPRRLQVRPSVRVLGPKPLRLLFGVAVAARGLLRGGSEVPQEAGGSVQRGIEQLPIPVDDLF